MNSRSTEEVEEPTTGTPSRAPPPPAEMKAAERGVGPPANQCEGESSSASQTHAAPQSGFEALIPALCRNQSKQGGGPERTKALSRLEEEEEGDEAAKGFSAPLGSPGEEHSRLIPECPAYLCLCLSQLRPRGARSSPASPPALGAATFSCHKSQLPWSSE